jgi:hypothetical protein
VKARALTRFPLLADHLSDALEFLRHGLVGGDNLIKGVGNLPFQPNPVTREPYGKVAVTHGLQASEKDMEIARPYGSTIGMRRCTGGTGPFHSRTGGTILPHAHTPMPIHADVCRYSLYHYSPLA